MVERKSAWKVRELPPFVRSDSQNLDHGEDVAAVQVLRVDPVEFGLRHVITASSPPFFLLDSITMSTHRRPAMLSLWLSTLIAPAAAMVEPLRINVERPLLGCVQKVLSYTPSKRGYHLITTHVVEVLGSQLTEMQHGMCNIFVQDMSCSLTVNQNSWRPGRGFDREDVLVAQRIFDLADVPSDPESFAKSLSIPVTSGKLALGPMQGLYLCEHGDFETPKTSTIIITAYGQLATLVGGMWNRSSTRREREATLLSLALSPSLSLSLWLRLSSAAVLSNPACARRPRPSSRARSIPSIGGQRSPVRRALALRTRGPTGTSRLTVDRE